MTIPAVFCNHANENPAVCDCPETCPCKDGTCANRMHIAPPTKQRPEDQPLPVKNDNPNCQDMVIQDIEHRKALGIKRYGTLLQPNNGRDFLRDAYEESMDLTLYLRGAIFERDGK